MRSGEEIQGALREFAQRWVDYAGSERSEAQTFLNELFACYGSDRRALGADFESFISTAGFLDLHWPEVCIIEMKAPSLTLDVARAQIERYWRESSDPTSGRRAARYVVVSNFREFQVWIPGTFPTAPVATFGLDELPDRYDSLAFLAGPQVEPSFTEHHRELTREAARLVAEVSQSLSDRSAAPPEEIQRFVLQSVWCMFAEDLGLLDGYPYQATLNEVLHEPSRSAAEVGRLFHVLNLKTNHQRTGRLAGTRYVNGDLFAEPAYVDLQAAEIRLMLQATEFDWRKVNPTIFGSLLEGVLGRERRWELGAHYTHEVDIMKIVVPTIVRPWRGRIEAATSPQQATDLLDELCRFRVLDPACGCGNFLYVAYRELRGLEHELKLRIDDLVRETGLPRPAGARPYFPLRNLQGIDIEQSAVMIARVVLWMGHRQVMEQYGEAEAPLPLQTLDGIRQGDALRVPWPETDCIIGNPPFLGASHVRAALGDARTEWLRREFGVGVKDLCTYWFRRAHDALGPGDRAGLVATNSVSQNFGRSASLDYIVERQGVLTDAVASQRWPGDAKVHVSIVNWVRSPSGESGPRFLDGEPVTAISSSLRPGSSSRPQRLVANAGRCFEGPSPKAKGLLVSEQVADDLRRDASAAYTDVVRPYLTARDITDDPWQRPSRWAVDFGLRTLEEAMAYPRALRILRELVKPERESNRRKSYREKWWLFAEPRTAMRSALDGSSRYAVAPGHAKRLLLCWQSEEVLASNATNVFAFHDDYSMGVLTSRAHGVWAWAQASTLETRLRYTPSSVFETFPWPDPVTAEQRERVAAATRALLERRTEICTERQIGLTTLYNQVDDGAWTDLVSLHGELDLAVAACYGWPASVAQDDDELVARLTDLNRQISTGERAYAPFD